MSKLEKLKKTKSLSELAYLLGFKPNALSYILYKILKEDKYIEFNISKKNGGTRKIHAPTNKLKLLQRRLADLLNICYDEIFKKSKYNMSLSHGFRKNHSIFTNAKKHINKRFVFNIDLQNFFPSINFGRVRGFFIKNNHFNLDQKVATIIAQIACYENELPQGSPCSPIISNLIGHLLDIRIVNLAKKTKCTYSRYADDLTFSTNKKNFPKEIAFSIKENEWIIGKLLKNEIEKVGFFVNEKKTTMQYKTARQVTTGLIVNKKVNIKREYYKKARSMCHSLFQKDEFYLENIEPSLSNNPEEILILSESNNKIQGTLNQLNGILSFIYKIKRYHDNMEIKKRRDTPNAITKLYRQFIFYKYFFSLNMPLIICEGKTDIIYLKCALKKLSNQYNDLIQINDNEIIFKIKFLNMTKNFKDVLAIADGTSGIKSLMFFYEKNIKIFKGHGKKYPVIILLDTDSGSEEIKKILKIKDYKKPFYKFVENLYVIFISDIENIEIEKLFEEKVLKKKINGKILNLDKIHGSETEYGKYIFAEKVIKANQKNINFDNFEQIFDKIKLVNEDFGIKLI